MVLGSTIAAGAIANGRAAPAPAAPHIRLVPIAAYDSLDMVGLGAWSPRGARLALVNASTGLGLYVVEAEQPDPAPRRVFSASQPIRSVSWSPDGSRLALVCGDSLPDQTMLAVSLRDGRSDTLIARAEIWGAAWGTDGKIYGWIGRHRRVFDAPGGPAAAPPGATPPVVAVAAGLDLRLRHWAPGMGEEYLLPGVEVMVGGTTVRLVDLLPDASRYLVAVANDTLRRWLLVDGDGKTVLDLRQAGITYQPTSLSADGRWIAGFAGRWQQDAGWLETSLRIGAASGRWTASVEGAGTAIGPQLSRSGSLIAYFEPESGTVRLGRLVASPR